MDCFFIGRLSGSKGSVWQYTAIDVASGYTWAELHTSQRNHRSRHCQALLHRLAHEPALAGWKLQTVTTDNGSEFVNHDFGNAVQAAGGRQRRIKAGRPTSSGCVERVQLTLLEECWRASFARSLIPNSPASNATSTNTSPTTTPTGRTPAATPKAVSPPRSATVPQDGSSAMICRVHSGLAKPNGADERSVATPSCRSRTTRNRHRRSGDAAGLGYMRKRRDALLGGHFRNSRRPERSITETSRRSYSIPRCANSCRTL